MFRLSSPEVVVTQQEHGRLAGRLAMAWGNHRFQRPDLPSMSFNSGVTFHDWHYGLLDSFPLDDLEVQTSFRTSQRFARWLDIVRSGSRTSFADPCTNLIAKRHLLRLMSGETSSEARELLSIVQQEIDQLMERTGIASDALEFADRITNFCDLAAYHVFRRSNTHVVDVFESDIFESTTSITMTIETAKKVLVHPWPFESKSICHSVVAYDQSSYPAVLDPKLIDIHVEPNNLS